MTKHELYINDILVDIDKDVNIYPIYQSPLLTDLDSIISNRANNISLPLTPNNAKAIQMFHLSDITDTAYSYPRNWNTVRYYRNGFNICNDGQGMVTDISGGRINFSFTWGASSKLQRLKDRSLSNLNLEEVKWSGSNYGWCEKMTGKCGYFFIDYGMDLYNLNYAHPCVTTGYLLQRIATDNKIKIDMTKFNENYLIPCLLRPIESLTGPTEKFSLKKGVPEMKQADFLKGILQIFGLFAYLKDDETIGFMSFKDLYDSDNFYDWTDKVITTSNSFDMPETIEFKLDGFAQTNTFNYTGDSDAEQSNEYKGNLYVNNSTIEKTKESVKSPFNYSRTKSSITNIGVYKKDKDGNFDSINDNLKPRILKEGTNYSAIFPDELKWSNILKNENYTAYQQAIRVPRVLKLKCLLTDWDLAHINFAFPVYFRQYGHFYAIIKIQTKAGGVCDCSFLQIK